MGRLTWKALVTVEILAIYLRVLLELRTKDIRVVAASLRAGRSVRPSHDTPRAQSLGRAVARVLAYAPRRSRCLVQSLVLTRMLARRGIESSLVIGVAPGDEFAAHAWVETAGIPLLPPLSPLFVPLARV
jgi:transglutaminase superfamily protein